MRPKALAATGLLVGALALAACGGGSDNSSSSSSSSTSTTSSTSTGGSVTAFCDQAKTMQSDLGNTFQNLSPNDLEGAKAAFSKAQDELQKVDDVAPSEIKPDVDKVLTTFKDISSAVNSAKSPQDLATKLSQIQSDVQGLQGTLQNLTKYTNENCK